MLGPRPNLNATLNVGPSPSSGAECFAPHSEFSMTGSETGLIILCCQYLKKALDHAGYLRNVY